MQIVKNENNHKIVVIPDVIFKNRKKIDWSAVEDYLNKYLGEIVTIAETQDIVYIGNRFPDEYKGSQYTKRLKGSNAKAKANAAQAIPEMIEIATDRTFQSNRESKHSSDAGNGWYYYRTYFAMPVYEGEKKTNIYNIYSACLLVNCALNGNLYLYDLVDIKKETSTPLKNYEIAKW
ncbi:MAG: hypothetical protein LUI87_03150 [Lachnospiraceae bacterium]|nr:hypothetical protein [Lachnospiraceae bacterium]